MGEGQPRKDGTSTYLELETASFALTTHKAWPTKTCSHQTTHTNTATGPHVGTVAELRELARAARGNA